jgi:hypothetical protein
MHTYIHSHSPLTYEDTEYLNKGPLIFSNNKKRTLFPEYIRLKRENARLDGLVTKLKLKLDKSAFYEQKVVADAIYKPTSQARPQSSTSNTPRSQRGTPRSSHFMSKARPSSSTGLKRASATRTHTKSRLPPASAAKVTMKGSYAVPVSRDALINRLYTNQRTPSAQNRLMGGRRRSSDRPNHASGVSV